MSTNKVKIKETALRLFLQKGYSVGINEIISSAGTSKGAFYHHFKSKKEAKTNNHFIKLKNMRKVLYKKLCNFSEWLDNRSRCNLLLLVLIAVFFFITAFIFPYFQKFYGLHHHVILDLLFGFTPEHANEVLAGYGDYGRKGIIVLTGIVDSVYPFVYGFLLALLLSRLITKPNWYIINIVPFVGMLFDFIENTGILIMTAHYPDQVILVAWITSVAGIIKWLVLSACILLLLFLLMKNTYKKVKKLV